MDRSSHTRRMADRARLAIACVIALAASSPVRATDALAPGAVDPRVTASAPDADAPADLDHVRVQATRLRGVTAFDTPASVDVVSLGTEGNRSGAIASEALDGLPGVSARDRQNHAQDTQLSIRGFGARSTFGVRGVRLFSDGIPASMPDGQGQLSHFSLMGGDRIEVIRGPFSALYGNSSGGVVQLWSADGREGDPWRLRATSGSDDTWTLAAQVRGGFGDGHGYNAAIGRFDTGGTRAHSAATRDTFNGKVHVDLGGRSRLELTANAVDIAAQDPLGLTAAQFRADPRAVAPVATQFDTRKTVSQQQVGAAWEHGLGDAQTLRVTAYAGARDVDQFLPLPVAAQANPLNSGGVIDLDNRYDGLDARWSWQGTLADRPFELVAGGNIDRQRQHRRGFENFVGDTLGVTGRPRRDERNRVENRDLFAQAWWKFADRWSVLTGVRHSEVAFRSDDAYVTATNPDDSGGVRYRHTAPVAGLMFAPSDAWRVYASAGRGFETPTFNEIGYRADGGAGLAFDLRPSVSDHVELGAKWRAGNGATLEAAVFRADSDDELAVARNVGGRSSFRNVGQARRQGVEAAATLPFGEAWDLRLAYTFVDATFESDFLVCTGAGCTVPATPVRAGARLPGIARQQAFARLQWQGARWSLAAEGVGNGDVVVDDIASQRAAGYGLLNLEAARAFDFAAGRLRTFARVDNAFDRTYAGSVIVNEGNGRFFEPGPGRGLVVGAQCLWTP